MIHFKNVSLAYPDGTVALKDINLHIDDGEFVFLMGHSGAGKTSLTKLLLCEEKLSAGSIEVNGYRLDKIRSRKIPYLRRTMGVVFQDFKLFDKMTVYENVAFAMRVIGEKNSTIRKRVPFFLNVVGLTEKADSFPDHLSGGEQQRVAFARAMVNNPSLIIADEPTGNIDNNLRDDIMDLLLRINRLGKTVIVVTHDEELIRRYRKRTVEIRAGEIISDRIGLGDSEGGAQV
ncbi:MAG: cell division ATP-binding protein FtsE [Clostridia bacterium]|jgi:cell division transport system ATP-binding protein|nr:cell division ATP-binding protein FtsE [Clostridia bacterium]MBQ1254216.1 cell division ATP-binding protein FtsE [Clostridia bacterium]MBQ2254189.1 cell division ATP-binding protein FtsE [Clostridia bacterium]